MKRRRISAWVFLWALGLSWMAASASAGVLDDIRSKGVLVVSTDANYAPQSFLNDKGELVGFDIDVAREVARRLGVKVKFVTPDWDLIVAGKWGGRWDLSIGSMTITAERARVVDFSTPYYYTPAQFAVYRTNRTIIVLSDFRGKTVGVGSGTTYESYLDPNQTLTIGGGEKIIYQVKGAKVRPYSTDMEAVQDLALGDGVRLDGVLTSGYVVTEAIKKGMPIRPVGNPVYYEPLAAASDKARPGSAELIEKVSQIFRAMHEDGTLTKLSMKWYGMDVTKKAR
ncbi:MAG: transporter substrate-binding domain-containing protein [Deltaproteobacteria bacterium]|nr:transporter substrate-binding domain-containing protein [Deltaproteobacteria bacterium]MBW2122019.1 transporter substrate-binding domain-containing protein [Deltaproteobacteria bacterium]